MHVQSCQISFILGVQGTLLLTGPPAPGPLGYALELHGRSIFTASVIAENDLCYLCHFHRNGGERQGSQQELVAIYPGFFMEFLPFKNKLVP